MDRAIDQKVLNGHTIEQKDWRALMDWLRLWHDMPTDPKWRVIARRSGQTIPDVMSVFLFVLVNASCNATQRGVTQNIVSEDIAAALDIDITTVDSILTAMQGKVLDGDCIMGWEKRQPKREDFSTERVRQYRKGLAAKRDVTQGNARGDKNRGDKTHIEVVPVQTDKIFLEFKASCLRAGMLGSDQQWENAETIWWPSLKLPARLNVSRYVNAMISNGDWADAHFVPELSNFIRNKKWEAGIRPKPMGRCDVVDIQEPVRRGLTSEEILAR